MNNDVIIEVKLYGKDHYKNFRKLCFKLAREGNTKKLNSFKIIEHGYKRKLAECYENALILECLEIAKQVNKQKRLDKQAVLVIPWTVKSYGEKKFYGIKHNL